MIEVFKSCALDKWLDIVYEYHKGKIPYGDIQVLWEICLDKPLPELHNDFISNIYLIKKELREFIKVEPYEFLKIVSGMGL